VPIYGTLVTSAIALVIAVPVSIGIALFLTDVAPLWTRRPIAVAIELLAAVPSIIYGMWGLFVFAPFMGAHVEPWLNAHLGNKAIIGPFFSGPRERLLDSVWAHDHDIELRTVDVHVRRLRKALNEDDRPDLIRTVRSAGYALDADGDF
jgi:hypothetical protein